MEKKSLSAADLNAQFSESKTQLSDFLADARVHNNIFAGNHFQKRANKISRGLDKVTDDKEVKIRVTKNHTDTICKFIINNILSIAPTGIIEPKNPGEIQDQKAAELHASVWEDYKLKNKFKKQVRSWVHDYVVTGEVWLNVFWDPNLGNKIADAQEIDPKTQQAKTIPVMDGDVLCERIFAWDMRQDPTAKSREEAKWEGFEKMVHKDRILKTFGDTEANRKACTSDSDDTYKIFDASNGQYRNAKDMVLLKQMYYKPCLEYPRGYFVFFTKDTILAQGELPADSKGRPFYPIFHVGFDEIPTSPRSQSIIKQIRPYQMEINRCASAVALTQMTVGFDKMIAPSGGEITSGGTMAGIRVIKVPGGKVNADIIPGRSGEQFLNYGAAMVTELYNKVGVPEMFEEKQNDVDMMASLYKNMRQKTRFSLYGEKFSEFLVEVCEEILRLKKAYMQDQTFVQVVGRAEQVNIPEFRNSNDLGYQIKIEQGTEDLESQFGRHMSLTSIMQYLGPHLDKDTTGMLIKNLPFSNKEEISSKFTINYENARNIMLALDRGEVPAVTTIEDPLYISTELNHRMRKPDFKFLHPAIQQAYQQQVAQYQQLYNDNLRQVQLAQQGLVPFDGPTVPVDGMYEVTTGANGQPKTERLQFPQSSLNWLAEKLKTQGAALGDIATLPLGQQAQIAQQFSQGSPSPVGAPSGDMNGSFPSR